MIHLSRHIEALLLNNDCVIVPGFGGFVTQYVPARFVTEENLYLPPYRTVGFNSMLTLNDGLLVESYMKAHSCNYAVALRRIEMDVEDLKRELENKGEVLLPGVGELLKGDGGLLNFHPVDGGVATPKLYALDSCYIQPAVKMPKKTKTIETSEHDYILRFNRNMVNAAAAAVIGVLFYFIWAPVMPQNGALHASMVNVPTLVAEKPVTQPVKKVAPVVVVKKTFVIDTTGQTNEKRADRIMNSLKRHGFDDARIDNRVRVIVGNFATENEAREFIQQHLDDSRYMKTAKVVEL